MTALRALMLLALVAWVGGIIFFAFVLAPAAFTVLPSVEMAGNLVSRCLTALHWAGMISGAVFLACSLLHNRLKQARAKVFSPVHGLLPAMIVITMISQFGITPRMRSLRREMGGFDNVSFTDARRVEFDRLHEWSTRAEGGVLLLGLTAVVLTARRFS